MLIDVAYPATATAFFSKLMEILTFQYYDFKDFYNKVFSLDPDARGSKPLNDQFELMGYTELYIIQNFGTLCWTLILAPTPFIVSFLLTKCFKDRRFVYYKIKFSR
jgi:hypothetical protein